MTVKEIIFVVEETDDGGYTASALGHSIFTEAEDWEGIKEMIRDAVKCHFDEEDRPQIIHIHAVREESLAV